MLYCSGVGAAKINVHKSKKGYWQVDDFILKLLQLHHNLTAFTISGTEFSILDLIILFFKVLQLHHNLTAFTVNGTEYVLDNICLKPNGSDICKVESLLQYYQLSKKKLEKCITNLNEDCNDPSKLGMRMADWHDQIIQCSR